MNQREFTEKAKEINPKYEFDLSPKEWETVLDVYNYHPSIDPIKGKAQIANLYINFGMRIIKDMHNTAKEAEEIEEQIRLLQLEMDSLKKKYENLKK